MTKYIDAEKLTTIIEERKAQQDQWINRYHDPINQGISQELTEILSIITSLQQEQSQIDDANKMGHAPNLEHWLAFFGMPEENIENCATQISQDYGAIRYLEGVQHGAEAVNELAQQEQLEVDLEKEE